MDIYTVKIHIQYFILVFSGVFCAILFDIFNTYIYSIHVQYLVCLLQYRFTLHFVMNKLQNINIPYASLPCHNIYSIYI